MRTVTWLKELGCDHQPMERVEYQRGWGGWEGSGRIRCHGRRLLWRKGAEGRVRVEARDEGVGRRMKGLAKGIRGRRE